MLDRPVDSVVDRPVDSVVAGPPYRSGYHGNDQSGLAYRTSGMLLGAPLEARHRHEHRPRHRTRDVMTVLETRRCDGGTDLQGRAGGADRNVLLGDFLIVN